MIAPDCREPCERIFCSCISRPDKYATLIDDGKYTFFSCTRIGTSILLCGKRKSKFPFQCLVGPDWPMVVAVYGLIIVINAVVLAVIAPIGWPPVLIGSVGAIALLFTYSVVVCSDPGIVFRNDFDVVEDPSNANQESTNSAITSSATATVGDSSASSRLRTVPQTIDCGACEMKRPYSARHCSYCEVCVEELDHHCPWCGKCIGAKNIKFFYAFLNILCFQIYYLIGCFIYWLLAIYSGVNIPTGPHLR